MPRQMLKGVQSGFASVKPNCWYPVSISEAKTTLGKPGTKNEHNLRLQITFALSQDANGSKAGTKIFGGGQLEGQTAGLTRQQLEQIRPDIDWGEFEFPEPGDDQSELEEELVAQDGYVFVTESKPDANGRKYTNVATFQQDEPDDFGEEDGDDLDDEE